MWQLSYRPEVEDDIVEAVVWYDDKRPGLGDEFLVEYLSAIQRIRDNPLLFAVAADRDQMGQASLMSPSTLSVER
ncbi:hypothetical protein [Roseimaritima sediminicola]|uniref:hypothetical protein n=1 Tax=Roseimaritima sediminicola TaxID=2662066 RepID=UPI0012982A84|nr:hypothetical protein [Roseimaritima sediminicola]